MAELEAGKANPNPEPAKPAVKPAVDATKYVGPPAVGSPIHPNSEFLLELGINAERELRGISNLENRVGFKQSAR